MSCAGFVAVNHLELHWFAGAFCLQELLGANEGKRFSSPWRKRCRKKPRGEGISFFDSARLDSSFQSGLYFDSQSGANTVVGVVDLVVANVAIGEDVPRVAGIIGVRGAEPPPAAPIV